MYYVKNISLVFMLIGLSYCQTVIEQEEELTAKMMRAGAAAEPTVTLLRCDGHKYAALSQGATNALEHALYKNISILKEEIHIPLYISEVADHQNFKYLGSGLPNAAYLDTDSGCVVKFRKGDFESESTFTPATHDMLRDMVASFETKTRQLIIENNRTTLLTQDLTSFLQIKGFVIYKNIGVIYEDFGINSEIAMSPLYQFLDGYVDLEFDYHKYEISNEKFIKVIEDVKILNLRGYAHEDLSGELYQNAMLHQVTKDIKIIDVESIMPISQPYDENLFDNFRELTWWANFTKFMYDPKERIRKYAPTYTDLNALIGHYMKFIKPTIKDPKERMIRGYNLLANLLDPSKMDTPISFLP